MLKFSNSQIIVVDDGSTDKTYDLLRAVKDIILLRHKINLGKGAAIRTGLERTQGEYIVFIDGDLDISSAQIRLLFDVLEVEQADVVIGSKLHSCSIVHYPVTRRILSLGYYWLIKFLFGLSCHDTQTGLKLFKSAV